MKELFIAVPDTVKSGCGWCGALGKTYGGQLPHEHELEFDEEGVLLTVDGEQVLTEKEQAEIRTQQSTT